MDRKKTEIERCEEFKIKEHYTDNYTRVRAAPRNVITYYDARGRYIGGGGKVVRKISLLYGNRAKEDDNLKIVKCGRENSFIWDGKEYWIKEKDGILIPVK